MSIKELFYKLKYYNKFKKFDFDDSFVAFIISCLDRKDHIQILKMIDECKTKEQFMDDVIKLYNDNKINTFVPDLLVGNFLGKYRHYVNGYEPEYVSIIVEPSFFTSDKLDLIPILREKFYDYIMSDNIIKNSINISLGVDLNADISIERTNELFDSIIEGKKVAGFENVIKYLYIVVGNYTREDILNNFNFILYDINQKQVGTLDERRKKYEIYSKLSNDQIKLIDDCEILKKRLKSINNDKANNLLNELEQISSDLISNIDILQDIYFEYEILLRNDLLDRLYCPIDSFTLIKDYKDVRPQLIHLFVRSTEKIREVSEHEIRNKIISERKNGDKTDILSSDEIKRYNLLLNALEAGLNQFKTNYFIDKKNKYTDAEGMREYF